MDIKSTVTILAVGKPWAINDEATGQLKMEGCSIYYVDTQDFTKPLTDPESELLGVIPVKQSLPKEFYEKAKENGVPCLANVTYVMRVKNSKQVLEVADVEFIKKK